MHVFSKEEMFAKNWTYVVDYYECRINYDTLYTFFKNSKLIIPVVSYVRVDKPLFIINLICLNNKRFLESIDVNLLNEVEVIDKGYSYYHPIVKWVNTRVGKERYSIIYHIKWLKHRVTKPLSGGVNIIHAVDDGGDTNHYFLFLNGYVPHTIDKVSNMEKTSFNFTLAATLITKQLMGSLKYVVSRLKNLFK